MAIVTMQKTAVIAHISLKEKLIQALHEIGVLEITEAAQPPSIDHTEVNFQKAELLYAIETLKGRATKETTKALQKAPSIDDILHAAHTTDVRGIVDTLHRLEEDDTNHQRIIQEVHAHKQMVHPWLSLPYALDSAHESATVIRLLGTVPESKYAEWQTACEAGVARTIVEKVNVEQGNTYVCVHIWKADRARFEECATTYGWTTCTLPKHPLLASIWYEELSAQERKSMLQKQKNEEERGALSAELPNLIRTERYMQWLTEKQGAREASVETFGTVTLMGWMPKADMDRVEARLQIISPAVVLLKIKPDEGEDAPVLLRNNRLITPFESVTTLYGLPLSSEMDPTAVLSPFFALYFALCLTDAGYGLTLALIFGIYLLITRKSVEEARLPWLLFISGIVSIVVGALFGGWFGLIPANMPSFVTKTLPDGTVFFRGQLWNLSSSDGITFLQNLALCLGVFHIFFGVFLAGWHKWVHAQKASAFWEHFSLHILLGASILQFFTPVGYETVATYALYGALALAIWGKGFGSPWYLRPLMGVLGLINFCIGLLSNGLSYLRLLALGLVTGAIAMAVNQVAIEMSNLFPIWLGIPVMILIAFLGHLVSIALNTLGSFIHSGRLQFIEFFGQFFEGGGRPFSPLRRSTS